MGFPRCRLKLQRPGSRRCGVGPVVLASCAAEDGLITGRPPQLAKSCTTGPIDGPAATSIEPCPAPARFADLKCFAINRVLAALLSLDSSRHLASDAGSQPGGASFRAFESHEGIGVGLHTFGAPGRVHEASLPALFPALVSLCLRWCRVRTCGGRGVIIRTCSWTDCGNRKQPWQ